MFKYFDRKLNEIDHKKWEELISEEGYSTIRKSYTDNGKYFIETRWRGYDEYDDGFIYEIFAVRIYKGRNSHIQHMHKEKSENIALKYHVHLFERFNGEAKDESK